MEPKDLWTKTLRDGRAVVVRLNTSDYMPRLELWIDGEHVCDRTGVGVVDRPKIADGVTYSHYIGGHGHPAIALTDLDAGCLNLAFKIAQERCAIAQRQDRKRALAAIPEPLRTDVRHYGTSERAWDAEDEAAWARLRKAGY